MPTVRFEVDEALLNRLREEAKRDHRPVVWQVARLIAEALDLREARQAEHRSECVE